MKVLRVSLIWSTAIVESVSLVEVLEGQEQKQAHVVLIGSVGWSAR